MTSTLSPDTGEIIRRNVGQATTRIDPRLIGAPSFDAIPRRETDETVVISLPANLTIGIIDDLQDPPTGTPPPLPPTPPTPQADPERFEHARDLTALRAAITGAPGLHRTLAPMRTRGQWTRRGRHRRPAPVWAWRTAQCGGLLVIGAAIALAALAVW